MKVLDQQGNKIAIDKGFSYGEEFFNQLNFIKPPGDNDSGRNSIKRQCDNFYRDIMNYAFVDSHNQLLADGRFDLAAKNLNEINKLSLDPLTGLRKKEFLERKLTSLDHDISVELLSDYSLIMCDLDNFKEVNDTFGHSVGDDTLAALGKLVLQGIRPSDFAYRYGGEEFLILLPETNLTNSAIVAERIRKAIEDRLYIGHYGLNPITTYDLSKSLIGSDKDANRITGVFFLSRDITCSFGVANYLHCLQSEKSLFTCADENLYHAKEQGRNRVAS